MAGTNITFSSNANQITINGQAGGGGIAASDLTSTTMGLGSIGYLSSAIINLSSIISTPQLTSSLQGLGSLGYISTSQLVSTLANLGQIYNSTILVAGTNITFSSNANQITINGQAGGGGIAASDLTSTTKGLGLLGYVSSFATISSVNLSSGSIYASFLSSQRITASSITANKFVGDGSLITNVPNLGVTYITAGTGIGVNTNTGNVTVSNSGVLSISQGSGISITGSAGSYTITATGGVAGTVATADLVSTVVGIQLLLVSSTYLSSGSVFASLLSSQKITASSITANKFLGDGSQLTGINAGLASSDLTSTTKGLGSLGYISTLSAFNSGTVYYLNWSQAGPTYPYKALQPVVTSGSQQNDSATISAGANTDVVIQTFQTSTVLPSFISAGIWDLNLFVKSDSYYTSVYYKLFKLSGGTSIQIGANSSSIGISPADGTTIIQVVISIAVPYTTLSVGDTIYIELHGVNRDISSSHNVTVYYEDSTYSHVHTTFLDSVTELSTIAGLGSLGYVSTASLVSSVAGLGTFGYVSSLGLYSTIQGLGTFGYTSSLTLQSTIRGLGSAGYLSSAAELISSPQLTSSLIGLGTFGYTSSLTLRSTIQGLGTFGYLSSSAELISSPQLTSSLMGLGSMTYLSSFNTLSSLNISSGSLYTSTTSTTEITAGRVNFGTLYVNNAPIIFDQYGNLQLSFQTL